MLAITSRRSTHRSVPDAGTLTIISQILSILCIDVKLLGPPLKVGMNEGKIVLDKRTSQTCCHFI